METKRPTSPAAEEILGGYFPALDHGFVALVDYMGSDEDVERAARVSYGYGTRKVSATRGLIRYLRRHRHTTPSEMVDLKFHCAMPMFVARQWIRHRTACLAEGTEVYFDMAGGVARRPNPLCKLRVEDIWQRFQPTGNGSRADKQGEPFDGRGRVRGMKLRQVNEDSLELQHTRVVDVYRNGRKPVFRMTLADGKQIEATADHQFLFADGWNTLHRAASLHERGGRAVWNAGDYFLYVNGVAAQRPALYRDPVWLQREYRGHRRPIGDLGEACGVSRHTIRKWLRRHGLTDRGRGRFASADDPSNRPRESIDRWTAQVAARVHAENGWTCRLCHGRASELHCHHIVPVWADLGRARDIDNLTTLCGPCHRDIAGEELEYVERLGGGAVKSEWVPRERIAWNRLERAKLVRIQDFDFVGERETYDLEVEGPYHNFVANGIVTHNSVNEYSGRYSLMPLLYYMPEREQFALQSTQSNQGRDAEASDAMYVEAVERWHRLREAASDGYTWMVGGDVAREIARIDLPLSTYTQWYWKINLHNLLHFLSLRADPHAQWEIQVFARIIAGMVKRVAPLSYEAWVDYDLVGQPMSRAELGVLSRLLEADELGISSRAGASLRADELTEAGLSAREIRELVAKLKAPVRPDFELDLSQMKSAEEVARTMHEAVPGSFE